MSVISALLVISVKNPVYAVLWLIFAFFNSAGLFLLLGAEMLAMLLVIVYVGAVAVLFLFVVMMLNIKTTSLRKTFNASLPLGIVLAAVLLFEISLVVYGSSAGLIGKDKVVGLEENNISEVAVDGNKDIQKKSFKASENEIEIKREVTKNETGEEIVLSIEKLEDKKTDSYTDNKNSNSASLKREVKKDTNAHQIGKVLYTEYVLIFQLSGLILFVAMIGAIVLTLRDREGVKKQVISKQYEKNAENAIEIVKVETGKGI